MTLAGVTGPARIRRVHNICRRAFGQAVRWGWIAENPAVHATPPKAREKPIDPPAADQLARLVDAAAMSHPLLFTYVHLAVVTGARRGELVALRWADIDLDQGMVTIRRAVTRGRRGVVEKDGKTEASRRTIALAAPTVAELHAHRRRMTERAFSVGARLEPASAVFSTDPACRTTVPPESLSRWFKQLVDAEGMAGVRLHDLRHAMATQLLAAGVDVRTVAGRLGHANVATTLNRYAHFVPARDRDAADVMSRLLGG